MPLDPQELRQLSSDALRAKAEELQKDIAKLRFGRYQQKEKNVKHLRQLRHDLARVLTISTERAKTDHSQGHA